MATATPARPRYGRWPEDALIEHPGTNLSLLRILKARADENGLAAHFVTLNGKPYVDLNGLAEVLRNQRAVA